MRREARWLRGRLAYMSDAELGTVLSVGSGSREFRTVVQPWIEREVFAPLAARGVQVLHHELVGGDGVDVEGDLMVPDTQRRLSELAVTSILCLNVLEHVTEPRRLAAALSETLAPGGSIVLTVPYRFPYHPDPIDTMFRPHPNALTALFPSLDVIDAGILRCEPLMAYWLAKPGKLAAVRKLLDRGSRNSETTLGTWTTDSAPQRLERSGAWFRMALVRTELTWAIMRQPDGRADC